MFRSRDFRGAVFVQILCAVVTRGEEVDASVKEGVQGEPSPPAQVLLEGSEHQGLQQSPSGASIPSDSLPASAQAQPVV